MKKRELLDYQTGRIVVHCRKCSNAVELAATGGSLLTEVIRTWLDAGKGLCPECYRKATK